MLSVLIKEYNGNQVFFANFISRLWTQRVFAFTKDNVLIISGGKEALLKHVYYTDAKTILENL